MPNPLYDHYATHLEQIERLMMTELEHWSWEAIPQLRVMAERYLSRTGKRLRPLLLFLFVDLLGGRLEKSYAAAAAIEVYHTATLIYDDIQDNSEFRRGLPCAHVTASTSMAMNLAGTIRSLMYHILHLTSELTSDERLEIHLRIDEAATRVSLGQSIDIGWHEQWYSNYQSYPYEQMVRWKSAALFGCAATIGAFLAGGNRSTVAHAESIGIELGALFQKVDDYLDIFGDPALSGRPLYNDFNEGKLSQPVLCLLDQLSLYGQTEQVERVLTSLARREIRQADWQWLVDLMLEYKVAILLQEQFRETEAKLARSLEEYKDRREARERLNLFITSLSTAVRHTSQI